MRRDIGRQTSRRCVFVVALLGAGSAIAQTPQEPADPPESRGAFHYADIARGVAEEPGDPPESRGAFHYAGIAGGITGGVAAAQLSWTGSRALVGDGWGQLDVAVTAFALATPEFAELGAIAAPALWWAGSAAIPFVRLWVGPALTFELTPTGAAHLGGAVRLEFISPASHLALFAQVHRFGARTGWQLGAGWAF